MKTREIGQELVLLVASSATSGPRDPSLASADFESLASSLSAHLEARSDSRGAFEYLRDNDVDLVILDASLGAFDVPAFVDQLGRENPGVDLLVIGAGGTEEKDVERVARAGIELHGSMGKAGLQRSAERILEARRL